MEYLSLMNYLILFPSKFQSYGCEVSSRSRVYEFTDFGRTSEENVIKSFFQQCRRLDDATGNNFIAFLIWNDKSEILN